MATFNVAFSGGVDAVETWGQFDKILFNGTWASGDTWTLNFVSTLSGDFTIGAGNLLGATYSYLLTYSDRVFIANGNFWSFSAVGDPTGWEQQNGGAGKIDFQTGQSQQDQTVALAVIQNRMAVFGRYNIQIWNIAADPGEFSRAQLIRNAGTVAPDSVQSLGDLDVLYLDDTGIRSLRTKELSQNAFVEDIGSPIDEIVQAVLEGLTDAEKREAVSVVDPKTKRYWLYLDGVIYVFSYFPTSKVLAWSTYDPTYQADVDLSGLPVYPEPDANNAVSGLTVGQTYEWTPGANEINITNGATTLTSAGEIQPDDTGSLFITGVEGEACTGSLKYQATFVPEKFVIHEGLVYIRTTDADLIVYGGTNGNTYDNCIPTVELPWLDLGTPSTMKKGHGIDVAMKGKWKIKASMNPRATSSIEITRRGSATSPAILTDSTYDVGHFPYTAEGTHVKITATGYMSAIAMKLSKLSFLFSEANVK